MSEMQSPLSDTGWPPKSWLRMKKMRGLIAALIIGLLPATAQAHHVGGEQLPDTFMTGLLSGLGHPIIGLDHFAFIVAVGFAAAGWRRGWFGALAFVLAALVGCLLHLQGIDLPASETLVALSLLLLGACFVFKAQLPLSVACVGFGLAGIFHGYAYGEAIIGAEPVPLFAYLAGFSLIQAAIAALAWGAARRLDNHSWSPITARAYGAMMGTLGIAFIAF